MLNYLVGFFSFIPYLLNEKSLSKLENSTTIIELPLIEALDTTGDKFNPTFSNTPAAIGIINTL